MAWFSRKKDTEGGDGGQPQYEVRPENARAWFERARYAADTRNYEYAIECYITGLKFDPTNLDAHNALFQAASVYRSTGGKPATGKELRAALGDKRPIDRFAAAELAWVKDALDAGLAQKAMQQAAELGLDEVAYWIGEYGLAAAVRAKKPSKSVLVSFVDLFEKIGGYDKAVEAGGLALQLDRTDANLEARIRNLSAQATMDRGRYDQNVGEEGSFRSSVRDIEKQRELVEEESLAAGADAQQRRLLKAKQDWEADPEDQAAIARYGEALHRIGDDENDKEAIRVYLDGFKRTQQYRFRMLAGDVKLTMERRKLRAMRERAEASGDPDEMARVEQAERKLLEMEVVEYTERTEKYPTDLRLRYELGERLFRLGRYEEAIPALQEAQQEPRVRARSMHMIGLCFLRENWFDEAVESLRAAEQAHEIKDDDTHMAIRYDLMDALTNYARDHGDLDAAEEAARIASAIALKRLGFRDIRQRRDELRELVKGLRAKA